MGRRYTPELAVPVDGRTAANSETLRPVFDWFMNRLVIFNEQAQLNPQFSIKCSSKPMGAKRSATSFPLPTSASLTSIWKRARYLGRPSISIWWQAKLRVQMEEMEEHRLRFHHVTEQGKAVFELMNESNGTAAICCFLQGAGTRMPCSSSLRNTTTLTCSDAGRGCTSPGWSERI